MRSAFARIAVNVADEPDQFEAGRSSILGYGDLRSYHLCDGIKASECALDSGPDWSLVGQVVRLDLASESAGAMGQSRANFEYLP